MEKLRLQLDDLAVETFATTIDGDVDAGTVRGYDDAPTILKFCDTLSCNCGVDAQDAR